MGLTRDEVAKRMGVTQSAYAQLETSARLRKGSRENIANALGNSSSQLDF
ncbi:helix-turn-helix domain-containing protein [Variovorax davisae]